MQFVIKENYICDNEEVGTFIEKGKINMLEIIQKK